jgi:hypothetical protein
MVPSSQQGKMTDTICSFSTWRAPLNVLACPIYFATIDIYLLSSKCTNFNRTCERSQPDNIRSSPTHDVSTMPAVVHRHFMCHYCDFEEILYRSNIPDGGVRFWKCAQCGHGNTMQFPPFCYVQHPGVRSIL